MNNTPDAWKKVETERVLARKVFTSIGDDGIDMRFKGSYIESESEQRERLAHLVKNSIPEELKKTSSSEKIGELKASVSSLAMNTINSSDEGVVTSDMLVATQHDDNLYGALPEKNDPITQILARHGITDPAQFLEEHYMRQRKEFDKKMGDRFAALKHL